MSVTTSENGTLRRVSTILGTAMMLAWALWIGAVGFALMMAIAYALITENGTMATLCSILLFTPVMISALWGISMGADMLAQKLVPILNIAGATWWERRQPHRILYQAYFL